MGFIKEFKEFAVKGNVIDLAVGVVIGGAFQGIVKSMVDDIITPAILTPALKAANLTDLAQLTVPGTAIKYGNFISQVISFTIVALALFMLVKGINRLKREPVPETPAAPPEPTNEEKLLMEIRDALRNK
ncbi:MAG: large-conductance mechanosensitive channel protein MscL [Bacteroidia bacterium]|nr:large-conductance mechanosensitive channel protein MscL [Bacteroidia bacterium]